MAVIWSVAAQRDLARIFDFNMGFSENHAIRIDDLLGRSTDPIERNPDIGRPIASTKIRERSLPDIQYVIRYRVEVNGITILQVRHTREHRERS